MHKILLIDDDKDLLAMLKTFLNLKGLEVVTADKAIGLPSDFSYIDLILLDINMPEKNGFELCQWIRSKWNMPILFLTARMNEEDKIKGLMLGGDDYITKPFSLDELYARIYTNLNRANRTQKAFELHQGICKLEGIDCHLTHYEYEIVDLLYSYPRQVFSKERIYERIANDAYDNDPQVIAEHIRNIRNKFKKISQKEYIKTHWGMGYSWIG